MGGHIDIYIDLNSIYSYFALTHLLRNRPILSSHSITLDFHPIYLPALQSRSGNRVIWTVPARQRWLERYELPRSKQDFAVPEAEAPGGDLNTLFEFGQTSLPLRALIGIKNAYPSAVYESAFCWLFHCFWTPPQRRIRDEGPLREALMGMPAGFAGVLLGERPRQFSEVQVERILEAAKERGAKDQLRQTTDDALKTGGFGAPWMLVRNEEGKVEPFFGSDRFAQVYQFLRLPYRGLELLPKDGTASKL
ncbi:hypothetical protein BJ170DRAFT_119908 [Xylariales sp. AK1849]|nr:hypothetical protein BJ170DRAFT_119908 [Xylariales sp. AK1849]